MSIAALSPLSPEPPSPVFMSVTPVTPTLDPDTPRSGAPLAVDQSQGGASSGPGRGCLTGGGSKVDFSRRTQKPPPLHTGADWKVVLHLPEIETWLRATSERVTQLTHSVGQDADSRHVDVHLVQLKDICEDISDHVEQIHALLETEFSLKLLSYSVNIIVDIRTVQLLWHQLRVSVLVLKERLLQGLQDSNGNFTRQTDILQAFSQDQHQTRLDALTEVDDSGQLTIRCSQDYFSLDCGITAFELSDYSPSDEPEVRRTEDPPQESSPTQDSSHELHNSLPELCVPSDSENLNHPLSILPTMQCGMSNQSEGSKRRLQGSSQSTQVSPTHPSLPKRAALFSIRGTKMEDSRGNYKKMQNLSELNFYGELSQSTPSLVDPPDRSKFWLELDSVYPENVSQSYESLQVMNKLKNKQVISARGEHPGRNSQRRLPEHKSSSGGRPSTSAPMKSQDEISNQMQKTRRKTHTPSQGDSDSPLPSPIREQNLSSDLEASGEESDPQLCPGKTRVWIVKQQVDKDSLKTDTDRQDWYGSEEFLALPAQLHKTEMLALKLENRTQSIPLRNAAFIQKALQDVDDWELTEFNTDWDGTENWDKTYGVGQRADDSPSPPPLQRPFRRIPTSRLSPSSCSDVAPSLDESIESGPLSDLQSEEEEGRRSADGGLQLTAPPVDGSGCASLIQQLLEDIQGPDRDLHIWRKMECFVQKLDGFISWLQEALDSTENWTQPRQDLDSLRAYLDTHLSFKLNVDSRGALKESIVEEGKVLLSIITCHQSALKDILLMVSSQWDQLQRQIRRQHGWMLRSLRCIQARLFYTNQSHEPFTATLDSSTNEKPRCAAEGLKADLISGQWELQRVALEKMAVKLSSLKYPSPPRRHHSQLTRNNSLQEFEAEYQELWAWLMDMDAMVTDSHQLMMSEDQRHQLFKSSHAELMMMDGRKSGLLGRAASLRRSCAELPTDFHSKVHNLTHTWQQLERILSERWAPGSSEQTSCLTVGGQGVAAEGPRSVLSPLTNSLLEQLEARIKELKAWLRDTELLIFNSCLRQEKDASQQLPSFKSLCSEIRARRRGVASVLKLCQKLLQQSQSGPMAEVGPEAEQHREALQLLSINLERRWEAIVMQALQWQNRLKRELGERQVNEKFLEAGLLDLCQISPAPAGPTAPAPDDSWEWDETDMAIPETEPQEEPESDPTHNLQTKPNLPSDGALSIQSQPVRTKVQDSQRVQHIMNSQSVPPHSNIFQVFSLHNVELYKQPQFPLTSSLRHKTKAVQKKPQLLLKSLSKDSSLSSVESLPDLLGGVRGQSENRPRSDSESGIVSDTGDIETTTSNSEIQAEEEDDEEERLKDKTVFEHRLALQTDIVPEFHQSGRTDIYPEKGWRRSETEGETKRKKEEKTNRRNRRTGGEAVEFLINGHGILTPADSDSDFEGGGVDDDVTLFNTDQYISLEYLPVGKCLESSPVLSQSSSLESLLALGVDLFPSKDPLHRSTSLESCLNPCCSTDVDAGSLREPDLGQRTGRDGSEREKETESAQGELSRRTLDLLKRLENIQNPLVSKMTRSVSDMTLQSSSPQRSLLPVSPSLGGQHSPLSGGFGCPQKELPLLTTRCSGKASLTELSGTEDSSLGSEDFSSHRNHRQLLLDPNMATNSRSCRKLSRGNNRVGPGVDDADGASLSMVVNVSCTSACTDDDEDNSDLLSSSTLTLTEEELGVRDEEDGEKDRLSGTSSGNEEEEMESSYILGLEYMKRELQSWIKSPRSSCSSLLSKTEVGLRDELQCGTSPSSTFTFSAAKETNNNKTEREEREKKEENRRNATQTYISQFVDDVENGNVDQSCLTRRDEDDELLREESSVFTKKGDALMEFYVSTQSDESNQDGGNLRVKEDSDSTRHLCLSPSCEILTFSPKPTSSLVGQLRGELPCHGVPLHSPPSLSPGEDCRSQHALHSSRPAAGGRKALNIQEKFKFSSFVTEETRREVRAKDSSLPPKKRLKSSSCCSHPHSSSSSSPPRPPSGGQSKKEGVHSFVMEIIDMASVALKNKENQTEGLNLSGSVQDQSPGSLAQIRDKVLEHSHQPLHLRKGDFYSYLSLSSHDSDCGEVSQCTEDKSSTPVPYSIPSCTTPTQGLLSPSPELLTKRSDRFSPSSDPEKVCGLDLRSSPVLSAPPSPDIRDEETLFAACTEEVYLGPPLCYSMVLSKKSRRFLQKSSCGDGLNGPCLSDLKQESEVDQFQDHLYFQGPGHSSCSPCPPPVSPAALGEELRPCCEAPAGKPAACASVGALQEERSHNEGPPYLNPWLRVALIDSSAAECLADTKTLGSNMGAVMTEISVCSSATNPSKEPAAATRINPKINCSAMRGADREDRERRGEVDTRQAAQEEEGGDGWSSSQQDPKATMEKQRPPVLAAGASRIQL